MSASGSLQDQIDAVESGDVDSVNAIAGHVLVTGTQNVSTQTAGQTITVTGPDLSSYATTADVVTISGHLQTQIDEPQVDSLNALQGDLTLAVDGGLGIDVTGSTITISGGPGDVTQEDLTTVSGYLQGQIDAIDVDEIEPAIIGSDGITVVSGAGTTDVQGFYTEFTTASGSLQDQIDGIVVDEVEPAIVGSDGITVVSGASTTDVQGFYAEFVSTSGSLQTQVDANAGDIVVNAGDIADNTTLITTTSGHLQGQIDGIVIDEIEPALVGYDGITVVSGAATTDLYGFHTEFVAASGTLQDQIDNIDPDFVETAIVGADGITVISGTNVVTVSGFHSEFVAASGSLQDCCEANAFILDSLIPPAAPTLDYISATSAAGNEGKNTWNSAQPITTYVDLPGDGLDVTFSTAGTENGCVASGAGAFAGILNDDVSAHAYAYPADSFGEADEGTLQLLVNSAIVHTVDLSSFGSGASVNANGSGFTLSAAIPVEFASGDPFTIRQYRTGTWNVEVDDQANGYDSVQVRHVVTTGTIQSTLQEWVVDDDTTATSYTGEVLDTLAMTGSKNLSGVEYHTGGTAKYDITIQNAQRNTYRTGSPISFVETNVANITNKSFSATAGDEGQDTVITNENVTINATRLLNQSISVATNVLRTVGQTSPQSTGASITGLLMDNASATSTTLSTGFDDENYRIQSDEDFATDLAATWDESVSLVGGDAGHNDGLQVYNSRLIYPVTDFSSITNGPAGNVDYSSAAGTRYFYGYFTNTVTSTANFRLTVQGSATLISEASALGTGNNNVKISLRAPSETGWLDVMVAFIEGNFGDGDGCYSSSLGTDQTIPTTNLGCTIGTKSTANSFDKMYFRITVGQGWTGYLTGVSIVWGAS